MEKFKHIFIDFVKAHPYDVDDLGPKYAEPYPELYVDPRSGNSATPPSLLPSLDVPSSSKSNPIPPETFAFSNTDTCTSTDSLPMDADNDPSELVEEGDDQQWATAEPVDDQTKEDNADFLDSQAMDVDPSKNVQEMDIVMEYQCEGDLVEPPSSDEEGPEPEGINFDIQPLSAPPNPSEEVQSSLIQRYAPSAGVTDVESAREYLLEHKITVDPNQQ